MHGGAEGEVSLNSVNFLFFFFGKGRKAAAVMARTRGRGGRSGG